MTPAKKIAFNVSLPLADARFALGPTREPNSLGPEYLGAKISVLTLPVFVIVQMTQGDFHDLLLSRSFLRSCQYRPTFDNLLEEW